MPLAARSARAARASPAAHGNPRTPSAPAASRASIVPREIFGSDKLSARTSVQNEPIYVVIPLRVDRSICGMQAVLRISFTVERNRPTPPGPDRVIPLALPPGEGDHLFLFGCLAPFPPLFAAGGRPPTPTLRRNPLRLVGLVPPEIGIPRSCKAQAAHPECHGPVYAGVRAASVICALTSPRAPPETSRGVGQDQVQEGHGAGLGQGRVAVAALGGLDAGGAARLARAGADRVPGGG